MEKNLGGGNTKSGFISFYENIIDRKICKKFVILKGGSGVGKSTIINKIINSFPDCKVEKYYCTSDLSSLDGAVVKEKSIAVLDGTYPHIVEPILVGIRDKSVDLSRYIDTCKLSPHKEDIACLSQKKRFFFNNAYAYIKSAGTLFDNIISLFSEQVDSCRMKELVDNLEGHICFDNESGSIKKLFCGGITYSGEVYLDNVIAGTVVYLSGDKRVASLALFELYNRIRTKCSGLTLYMSPICKETIYAIGLNNIVFTCDDGLKTTSQKVIIEISNLLNISSLKMNEIKRQNDVYSSLLDGAAECLKDAKNTHIEIENFYSSAVDFDGVNQETERLIEWLCG